MQVSQVNNSAASALGQTSQAEESRADDFARLLKSAFSGKGEAVAKTTERALTDAAPRTETRRQERTAERSPERSSYDRRDDYRTERSETRRDDETAPRDTAPVNKTDDKAPARNDDKPAKDTKAADTTKPAKTEDTAAKADDAPATDKAADAKDAVSVTDKPAKDTKAEETVATEDQTAEETKPKVAVPDDMLMILHLLQQEAGPVTQIAAQTNTTTGTATVAAPSAEEVAAAALAAEATKTAAVPATAKPAVPVDAAAQAAALAAAKPPVDAAAQAAVLAAAKTDTSAAALLSQQQETATPEDMLAIQQALAAQTQVQTQGQVQTELQAQTTKPVVAEPKTTPKSEKSLTLDVQTVTATTAPKTLVDQSSLFAMQGDDQSAADAALLQQQAQQAQVVQQNATELKFNTALLQAAAADAQLQAASGNTASAGNAGQSGQQQVAPMSATGNTPATQATQQAAAQTTARHLNTYVPAGEQVAVQIKKGVAEGVDKISIKLDPGNLGKVEIKLEIGHDGRLTAIVAADKPETLQLLQQDVKNLEQSLRDSGLKTDQQSLSFTLRDQGQGNDGRDGQGGGYGRQRGRGGDEYADAGMNTDPAQLAAANAQRAAAARGGLDIKI